MTMSDENSRDPKPVIMPHSYDGIQEYDQSLPNWWLFTLFASIAFAFLYWMACFATDTAADDRVAVNAELDALEARQLAAVKNLDDATLWKMSRNAKTVAEGQAVYNSLCFTCHGQTLAGMKGLGFRLNDEFWVHGNTPTAIFNNISEGIVFEGKPTGMASQKVLGTGRIAAVTAFLLSMQKEGAMKTIPRKDEPSQLTP
jgi:cytochrome c oxidase cbb3-type subunit 3